jgi:hypothetical protein
MSVTFWATCSRNQVKDVREAGVSTRRYIVVYITHSRMRPLVCTGVDNLPHLVAPLLLPLSVDRPTSINADYSKWASLQWSLDQCHPLSQNELQ